MTTWLEIEAMPEGSPRWPRWKRLLLVDESSGEVFAPAAASPGGEEATFWAACNDGVPVRQDYGHSYVPLSWLEENYPSWAEVYAAMRKRAEEGIALGKEGVE